MSRVEHIRRDLEDYRAAQFITGALQDISAMRMQATRKEFEKNIGFFKDMQQLYRIVKAYAVRTIPRGKSPKSRKTHLYVAITSNKHFYGTLNRDIIFSLLEKLPDAKGKDCLIVGETGWQYIKDTEHEGRCKRILFKDDMPTTQESDALLQRLNGFERVFVFYPKFVNPFRQDVTMVDITETPDLETEKKVSVDYILEPDIPALLTFFETAVRSMLFGHVMLESELARSAARLMKMRNAQERARELATERQARLHKEIGSLADMQLLETFAGYTQWKK
ncbi:hypothetical protein A2851_02640 [Candidatus Kaiserbacteria bacterium RIFCSPHIGHO2_01_FULL_53_29]|uniref:ATP synthase gamma chain n=1 Tax=Candidatus Kaiserbacteria bacterium RIFCSPHIGHO2_01_FULL_53_29 TaxID=1798480 RepID=A0A1F6CX59_9BACT|nr:MAG: hypothetical protein A2851_02640 [Candidatus Kaiserbacteria bacterium RIFCSPHIGHO2_01_FULL_53_29]